MAAMFSPAGQALGFGGADTSSAIPAESEEDKRKRLAAIASAQAKLGGGVASGSPLSAAGMALGLGSYGST
jgi:hypothetical protein